MRRFSPMDRVLWVHKRRLQAPRIHEVEVWYYTEKKVIVKLFTDNKNYIIKHVDEANLKPLEIQ